ncbi:hypothetical protein Efla_006663 [Eimeria flavescens]
MTASVEGAADPLRGPRNLKGRKSSRPVDPLEASPAAAAVACSSAADAAAAPAAAAPRPKRLQLDERLMQRVRKIQQQQQQQQQQGGLVLLGKDGGGVAEQQQQKAEQVQQQQQIHSKLVALRVCLNSVLRLANNFPPAFLLQQLQHKQQQQQEEEEAAAAALALVRKEAAAVFVLMRRLQQQLLQQSSLAAAYSAAAADPAAAPAAAGGGWQQRREAHAEQQAAGGEADVWRLLGDFLFSSGLRQACLANADAWHQQICADRSKGFLAFNQPVSVQLSNAMAAEEEQLLSRYLRAAHIPPVGRKQTGDLRGGEVRKKTNISNCAVLGCTDTQDAGQQMQHIYFDDADFYVELLKTSVASGNAEVWVVCSAKEVDRRASKGRRIRYKPIPQLEHFLAAEPWQPNTDVLPGAGDPLVVESLMRNLFRG